MNQVATDISSQIGGRTDQVDYTRDLVGNITRITNRRSGGTYVDTQCFNNDMLGRLTQAWTATDDCATTPSGANPSAANVGGPQPYWTDWEFDDVGNQTKKTDFAVGGAVAQKKTTTFTYGRSNGVGNPRLQPDTLTETNTVTAGVTGSTGTSYTYDQAGNTVSRTNASGTDTLTWNGEGELTSLKSTAQAKATGHLYDADGEQLIRRDPNGETTLYLPGQEVVLNTATGTKTATRYYDLPAGQSAVRTSTTEYSFVVNNLQGTGQLSLDKNAANPVWRSLTPYGAPRDGLSPSNWPGTKGFVGGTQDSNTGLTLLGARHYDPTVGRFVSADPVLAPDDPRQMGGYAYAGSNPISRSDPTGLMSAGACATKQCYDQITAGSKANAHQSASHCGTRACYESYTKNDCQCTGSTYSYSYKAKGGTHGKKKQGWLGKASKAFTAPLRHIDDGIKWVKKNKVAVTSFVVGAVVGVGCVAGAVAAGAATAGAGLALAAGCGAIAGAASEAVANAMDPNADHSLAGYGKAMLTGAAVGAVGGVVGAGAGALATKAARPLLAKVRPGGSSGAAAKGCPSHSFLAGTLVVLANGKTKPIETVLVGDKVKATDPVTGTTRTESVTRLIVTDSDKRFTTLTLRTPDKRTTKLKATSHHPYWETKTRRWVEAEDLTLGTMLRTTTGANSTVTATTSTNEAHRTFDLTVTNLHTYYVLAGATPVLVHNTICTALPSSSTDEYIVLGKRGDTKIAETWDNHEVLRMPGGTWSHKRNDEWIQGAIDKRQKVYLASDITTRSLNHKRYPESTFARELNQLMKAGYTFSREGGTAYNQMVPPPLVN
ncbi:RHS repeat-associated core domain-containing protein [Streptomyces sp. NPDC005963]|uniref:RHS repeat-associated core domain-containing protein n=1 Tax=Streptomyces sp. NPDC005963 TaxID=3156721 RepID=UPI0033E5B8BB